MKIKQKTKNLTIFLILSSILLMGGNLQIASAQDLDRLSFFDVHVAITPSVVEEGSNSHPIGYVYILNKNGISITTDTDVEVVLKSDHPNIASVPEKITFPANAPYAKFDVTAGEEGITTITGTIKENSGFADVRVGVDKTFLPDDLNLVLNFPTNQMHVSSIMPFTVFLETTEGEVVRAPFDVEIKLDYEKSLAVPSDDVLVIKEGDYYAAGTITTGVKVGNAFIRAIQEDAQLDTARSIEVSSTLPAALNINIYPYLIPAEINRNIDIFVTVVDSNGEPTIANKDIPLKFFSNNQDFIGEELDDAMEENKMVIKKGEFGFNYRLNVDLIGLITNDLMIGVSSAGYGTAIDRFQTVGESISVEDQRIQGAGSLVTSSKVVKATDTKAVQLFGPLKIPSNATAYFAYQMAVEEDDANDDHPKDKCYDLGDLGLDEFEEIDLEEVIEQQKTEEEERRGGQNIEDVGGIGDVDEDALEDKEVSTSETEDEEENLDVIIYCIDFLKEPNRYPLQAAEDYRSTGLIQYLDVISEDSSLATVTDPGNIRPGYSYGVAKVETSQKSGEFLISANLKGVGSGSFRTEVVNTLEQKEIKAFSPTGEDTVLVNRDGSFDLFLVTLDGSERPKVIDKDQRYLITPSNGIVDLKKGSTFDLITLQSESFKLKDGSKIDLRVESIGEDADISIESTTMFESQLSSKLEIIFPIDTLDITKDDHVGVIQLTDLQGNPIVSFKDMKIKISSSNEDVVLTNQDAVIKAGQSYTEFPMDTKDVIGESIISATSRGIVSAESTIKTGTSSSSLSVFTSGVREPIPVNEPIEVKLFVDDDFGDSVAGATVEIKSLSGKNATVNSLESDTMRTGPDGTVTFELIATNGPEIELEFVSYAEGYKDGKSKRSIVVDTPQGGLAVAEVSLPQELIYVIIGGIVIVGIVVGLFLKKSKEPIDEEEFWEDEDI